jgi:hypothetical protein
MAQYGMAIGGALLLLVTACALLLGAKAAAGVRQFREEHHERFLGRRKP